MPNSILSRIFLRITFLFKFRQDDPTRVQGKARKRFRDLANYHLVFRQPKLHIMQNFTANGRTLLKPSVDDSTRLQSGARKSYNVGEWGTCDHRKLANYHILNSANIYTSPEAHTRFGNCVLCKSRAVESTKVRCDTRSRNVNGHNHEKQQSKEQGFLPLHLLLEWEGEKV